MSSKGSSTEATQRLRRSQSGDVYACACVCLRGRGLWLPRMDDQGLGLVLRLLIAQSLFDLDCVSQSQGLENMKKNMIMCRLLLKIALVLTCFVTVKHAVSELLFATFALT